MVMMMMALSSLCPSPASPLLLKPPHLIHRKRCSVFFSRDPPPSVRLPFFTIPGLMMRNKALLCRAAESVEPLDLTEENVERVLLDARSELLQIFDLSVGITGVAELADMDGPFLKLRLKGRFWHERSLVLARLGNYLQKRIPEIVEVGIEDDSQLDDSSANFGHD